MPESTCQLEPVRLKISPPAPLMLPDRVKALPPAYRLRGWYLALTATLAFITAALGVYGGLSSLWSG